MEQVAKQQKETATSVSNFCTLKINLCEIKPSFKLLFHFVTYLDF